MLAASALFCVLLFWGEMPCVCVQVEREKRNFLGFVEQA
jgi:hypothetical protein